jgi:hypothetical protein
MKSNPSTKEIQEALARVEKAKSERTNAQRRLSRAKEAVDKAAKEVAEGEDEFKAASTNLDQAIRRGLAAAMKKGGADTSVRLAEIIAQSLGGGDDDGDPQLSLTPTPTPAPAPAPAAAQEATPKAVDRAPSQSAPEQSDTTASDGGADAGNDSETLSDAG